MTRESIDRRHRIAREENEARMRERQARAVKLKDGRTVPSKPTAEFWHGVALGMIAKGKV